MSLPPSPAADSTILYLLRHAATDNNLARPPRLQGRDPRIPISAEGRRQADQAARQLQPVPLHAIFSSPLRRAIETAEAVAHPHELPVHPIEAIEEVDVGQWEGRSWDEISQSEPEAYHRFMSEPSSYGYLGGENMTQVLERVAPAFEALAADRIGQSIAVVGHNVVNRVWLSHVMGLALDSARSINQDNAGISIVRYRAGQFRLLTLNMTAHLWPLAV